MIIAKENKRKTDKKVKLLLTKTEKNRVHPKLLIHEKHFPDKEENNREINKEIIRRLRIQNKKLIEQVIKLKEEIKKTRIDRVQVLAHINELLKLINR